MKMKLGKLRETLAREGTKQSNELLSKFYCSASQIRVFFFTFFLVDIL